MISPGSWRVRARPKPQAVSLPVVQAPPVASITRVCGLRRYKDDSSPFPKFGKG
jgi:hypothetical protein